MGAIVEFRTAIELDPTDAEAHNNLGAGLRATGDLPGAVAACRKAIEIDPELPPAHLGLGRVLLDQGALAEARDAFRRALRLLPPIHPLRPVVSEQIQLSEKMLELDRKLPALLDGTGEPADAAEAVALAQFCQQPYKALYGTTARLYAEAMAADPRLADDPRTQNRYNAACAAALAAAGKGKDADKPDAKQRARLRQQALDWLRADLTLWGKQVEKDNPQQRAVALQTLSHWQKDTDFASVRGDKALESLPAAERDAWRKLWADVVDQIQKAKPSP